MNIKQLSKKQIIGILASVVLVLVLIASILISKNVRYTLLKDNITVELGTVNELTLKAEDFFDVKEDVMEKITFDTSEVDLTAVGTYTAYAICNGQKYPFTVTVEDTTAPKAKLKDRIIFTNNIATLSDFSSVIESVKDASEYEIKLVRFEKEDVLCELNELEMTNLLAKISLPGIEDVSKTPGTTDIPTEDGIYRSAMEIADAQGNASYEEVFVVLDTMGASITEVEDLVVYVDSEDKLNEEPELNLSKYKGADNVDGTLTSDDLTIELTVRDEEKHEWITKVSYTDRAGNESFGEFLITVKLKKEETSAGGNTTVNGGGAAATPQTPVQNPAGYNPADTNMDGVVDGEESCAYIDADEQACINAGYGVVVAFNNGEYYMVLTHADGTVNGVSGMTILSNYLAQFGLEAQSIGSSSIIDNDWVWYRAYNIYVPLTPEDEGFWS